MKLLLTSVFKPFAVDDDYGRKENKIELFHNQVTREQGLFSYRFFHNSFGLYLMAENIDVPTTVLDFPTIKEFIKEIKKGYDYIGISFIAPNVKKTAHMAKLIRQYSPKTKIILGGHGTRIPEVKEIVDCDHVATGDGIRWLREFFKEDTTKPIKHPALRSAFSQQIMGIPLPGFSAVIMPGVGCPNACRFCVTSHFFDKKYTSYYETGKELYDTLVDVGKRLKTNDFFIMDENFLKYKERVQELMYYMQKNDKQFNFAIFSSAETIKDFGIKKLAELGVEFIWMGVESKVDVYDKNKGIDVKSMIAELRAHGMTILGSGILFLEHHDKETIHNDIDYLIDMKTDYTQFMQLGPLPQTALYLDYKAQNKLRNDIPYEEWHGQHQLWFTHPHFTLEESATYLKEAFRKEYEINGPSFLRRLQTHFKGYMTMKDSANPILSKRADHLKKVCLEAYPILPVIKMFAEYDSHKVMAEETYKEFQKEFGPMTMQHRIVEAAGFLCALKETLRVNKIIPQRQPKTKLSQNFVKQLKNDEEFVRKPILIKAEA